MTELSRERSKGGQTRRLGLSTWGYRTHGGRDWRRWRMTSVGVFGLLSPVVIRVLEGHWPRGQSEWLAAGVLSAAGAGIIWWYRSPHANRAYADTRRHDPWVDRVETTEGTRFQGMCDCDWRGPMAVKERRAAMDAHRHVMRRHWPRWLGRFSGASGDAPPQP